MCGIVGIYDSRSRRPVDQNLLVRMNESQHHRGPDESGLHVEPGVGLAHRRLSIIDLASGQQPFQDEEESVVLVYNGEIYNFVELREELESLGYSFRTSSDTEVIVHAWKEWGERAVEHFRGMFAFGLWDKREETLFLARDRLGIKPLYYALLPDKVLLFSSELKALLCYPGFPRDVDPLAVEDYFAFGYVPEPRTILKAARKLRPGHTLRLRRGEASYAEKEYWDVPYRPVGSISEAEAQEEMIIRLREAVKIRMISEVPLGAFLSGGVDSSAVVAMMSDVSDSAVRTCSISFGDPRYNEVSFAKGVADRYRTVHEVRQVEGDDTALIETLGELYDEPYADSSAIPTYRLCGLAREHVTVALSGDGGDETLAGYTRYRWHMDEERARYMLPQIIRGPLFRAASSVLPHSKWATKVASAKQTLQAMAKGTLHAFLDSVSVAPSELRLKLFSVDFRRELQGYSAIEVFKRHAQRVPADDSLFRVQYLDLKTYLPGDILTKVDRASMAHSLEVRVPLLDHHLVEWTTNLPPAMKLRRRQGKYIFKKALDDWLPYDVLYRKKMGFAVPLAAWLRGPIRERVQRMPCGSMLQESGIFNSESLQRLVDQHLSSERDHSSVLWALLGFEGFLRRNI